MDDFDINQAPTMEELRKEPLPEVCFQRPPISHPGRSAPSKHFKVPASSQYKDSDGLHPSVAHIQRNQKNELGQNRVKTDPAITTNNEAATSLQNKNSILRSRNTTNTSSGKVPHWEAPTAAAIIGSFALGFAVALPIGIAIGRIWARRNNSS